MAQMPIRLYACSSRRFITIHDGGLYHGEELLGDLHLTPGRDKALVERPCADIHKNAGGTACPICRRNGTSPARRCTAYPSTVI
jgi:hypothetical protein